MEWPINSAGQLRTHEKTLQKTDKPLKIETQLMIDEVGQIGVNQLCLHALEAALMSSSFSKKKVTMPRNSSKGAAASQFMRKNEA